MKEILLDDIKFVIDFNNLLEELHIESDTKKAKKIKCITEKALELASPKVLYKTSFIDEKGDDYVIIEGIKFVSKILRDNLDSVQKVFPYVATCGKELEEWSRQYEDDFLINYWTDVIKRKALNTARETLKKDIKDKKFKGTISKMNPG